jgi:hypothetical protein
MNGSHGKEVFMRFYKIIEADYILSIGTGNGGSEITESEYNDILSAIRNKPKATATTDYNLKTDLTWEPYEIEPIPEPTEIDDSEELNIILGGAS